MLKSERSIIEMSDVIFAQGPQLAERCSRGGKKEEIFPFGVNLNRFTKENVQANGSSAEKPTTAGSAYTFMSGLPRPVIGYVGGIHTFFDVEMLSAMARANPTGRGCSSARYKFRRGS